jgi:phosphoserine aminotransferase
MLALSPRAVERLESYQPAWPIPKIFRLISGGKLIKGIFQGDTINTPSMLCVEDQLDALKWAESIGGLPALIKRSQANLAALEKWVAASDWAAFLAEDPASRSSTSICLVIKAPWFRALSRDEQTGVAKSLSGRLEKEGVAFDVMSYRDTPPGLRLWGGATIEASDIEKVTPWLDWAYAEEVAARA